MEQKDLITVNKKNKHMTLNFTSKIPKVSIIIPSHNRIDSLKELLDSILETMEHVCPFEVIVVCDGCVDGSEEMVKKVAQKHPEIKCIAKKGEGPAKARNVGVRSSRGDIIAFTDDDCLVTKEWLKQIVEHFDKTEAVGLQGRTSTDRKSCTPLTHQIDNEHGSDAFPTCNVAIKKDAFWQVGGFDESFPYAHNEDADLAWRLEKIGKLLFVPSMQVIHPPRKEKLSKLMKRMEILESEFLLYYKDKDAYKSKRATNPWVNIYGKMFFKHIPLSLKSRIKYMNRPVVFAQGVLINLSWWASLIYLFPKFRQADKRYKALVKNTKAKKSGVGQLIPKVIRR
ncbi:glycosyltransferase [Limibacter armeniacum]|uniref:glycosyltransferase family 2 protein n=1 Tax=Limibacter armeniacum TaxID=466084 RepID=UPI002FE57A04